MLNIYIELYNFSCIRYKSIEEIIYPYVEKSSSKLHEENVTTEKLAPIIAINEKLVL